MIEIVTGATLMASTLTLHLNASNVISDTFATNSSAKSEVEIVKELPAPEIKFDYEKEVKIFYKDQPLLAKISKCESDFRQYGKDGKPLRGLVNTKDVGLMQINEGYHLERAKSMGYDIYTVEGNLGYAREMYNEQGAAPWSASAKCWSKA